MTQEEVIYFLKQHPNEWWTAKEIIEASGLSSAAVKANLVDMFRIKNNNIISRKGTQDGMVFMYHYCFFNSKS